MEYDFEIEGCEKRKYVGNAVYSATKFIGWSSISASKLKFIFICRIFRVSMLPSIKILLLEMPFFW